MGFERIEVVARSSFGLEDLTRYPLFDPEFIDFLRRSTPQHRHAQLVLSMVVTARKPEAAALTEPPGGGSGRA